MLLSQRAGFFPQKKRGKKNRTEMDVDQVVEAAPQPQLGSDDSNYYSAMITTPPPVSAKKKLPKMTMRSSLEEDDFLNLLHGSDPVKIELSRLQNEVKGTPFISSISISYDFFFFWPLPSLCVRAINLHSSGMYNK